MATIAKVPNKDTSNRSVSVYTLPHTSIPLFRVEVSQNTISAGWLFDICCEHIGLYKQSRPFFALFRGMKCPIKKYEPDERIRIPVRAYPLALLRWSFDLALECKVIRTDPVALKLLTQQYKSDIENEMKTVSLEDRARLNKFDEPEFMCYKQYIQVARTIQDYDSVTIKDVEVVKKVKFVNQVIAKGEKVDVSCKTRGLTLLTKSFDVTIPWRKIRRFAEISSTNTVSFEVLLDETTFTWVELNTIQRIYLVQVTGEYISIMQEQHKLPAFKQPGWVASKRSHKLTWELFKQEVFGVNKKPKDQYYLDFDNIQDLESSSDDDDDDQKLSQENSRLTVSSLNANNQTLQNNPGGTSPRSTIKSPSSQNSSHGAYVEQFELLDILD